MRGEATPPLFFPKPDTTAGQATADLCTPTHVINPIRVMTPIGSDSCQHWTQAVVRS